MRPLSFLIPNQRALPRSGRIDEEVWERCRPDIMREYLSGGSKGNAQALKWIKAQKMSDFNPSAKQLRHRIKVVWKEDPTETDISKEFPPLTNENDTTGLIENEDKGRDGMNSNPETRKKWTGTSYMPPIQSSADDKKTAGTRIKSWIVSASNHSRLPILDTLPSGSKKRERSLDDDHERAKRHHNRTEGNTEMLHSPDVEMQDPSEICKPEDSKSTPPFHPQTLSPAVTRVTEPFERPAISSEMGLSSAMSPTSPSDAPLFRSFSHPTTVFTPDPELEPGFHGAENSPTHQSSSKIPSPVTRSVPMIAEEITDPVLKPRYVQRLLARIGVEWDLIDISQHLRKEVVFSRTKNFVQSNPAHILPENRSRKIKAFADFLFGSSILDDAFTLYLLVWIMQETDVGSEGVKLLVRCAQSAMRTYDQLLIECLLKQRVSIAYLDPGQQGVMNSLECLELVNILQNQNDTRACSFYQRQAISWCPLPFALLQIIEETRQHIPHSLFLDPFTREIVTKAFKSATQREELEWEQTSACADFELRDVLFVITYLRDQDQWSILSGYGHLRNCIKRALKIIENPLWERRHMIWLERVGKNWAYKSRDAELAVLYELLVHWWIAPTIITDSSSEQEQDFVGMSDIDILSVIAYLATSSNDVRESFFPCCSTEDFGGNRHTLSVRERTLALLGIQDDKLLMGFLWCFVKLSRRRGIEKHKTLTNRYRDLISDMFTKSYNVEEDPAESDISSKEDHLVSHLMSVGSLEHTCRDENHVGVNGFAAIDQTVEKQSRDRLPRTAFAWDVYSAIARQDNAQIRESVMSATSANPTLAKSLSTSSSLSSMRRYSRKTLAVSISHWSNRNSALDELTGRLSVSTFSDSTSSRSVSGTQRRSRNGESYPRVSVSTIPEYETHELPTLRESIPTQREIEVPDLLCVLEERF